MNFLLKRVKNIVFGMKINMFVNIRSSRRIYNRENTKTME